MFHAEARRGGGVEGKAGEVSGVLGLGMLGMVVHIHADSEQAGTVLSDSSVLITFPSGYETD